MLEVQVSTKGGNVLMSRVFYANYVTIENAKEKMRNYVKEENLEQYGEIVIEANFSNFKFGGSANA